MSTPSIVAKECRFAISIPTRQSDVPDYHLIKEMVHFDDGTTKSHVRFEKDFVRPFWVTKKNCRDHKQKKEHESFEKLTRFEATQSDLRIKVARALDQGWTSARLQQLAESPYLYGTDISSTSIIKHNYRQKWPDATTPFSVSFFDIETDVVHGTDDPIMATLVFKDKILTVCVKSFVQGYAEPQARLDSVIKKYLQSYFDKHQFQLEFILVEDTVELIRTVFARAHEWSPDFMAIWNMDFDIPRIIKTLEKYDVDPKDIFSHPKLPPELRFCKYKKGSTKKITASGQVKPKNPSEQWHSVYCPAGFYIIDAMCSYRFVRQGEQEESSYSLDAILNKELGLRKLQIEGLHDEEHSLTWHREMQAKHPFEYIAYNIFDCIGMYELENKINDLQSSVPVNSGISDFSRFNSQTKRFADSYHFFLLERGKAIGTVPPLPPDKLKDGDGEAPEPDSEDDEDDDDEDESDVRDLKENDEDVEELEVVVRKTDVMDLRGWINKRVS